jgi:hypothetical protein
LILAHCAATYRLAEAHDQVPAELNTGQPAGTAPVPPACAGPAWW